MVNLVVALLVGVAWAMVSSRPHVDYTEGGQSQEGVWQEGGEVVNQKQGVVLWLPGCV